MYDSFDKIKQALGEGKSVESITQWYLDRIKENQHLNAFLEVFTESALMQAKVVGAKFK